MKSPSGTSLPKKRIRAPRALSPEEREQRMRGLRDAALDVFLESGFAAARLDEVAKRAGVAKGTLYLYFASKDALFEDIIRTIIASPLQAAGEGLLKQDIPSEAMLRGLLFWAEREVLGTRRKDIARLIISEAARFPELAAFYHREVVGRGVPMIRAIVERGIARGEFTSDAAARFPQLVIAPVLMAIVWEALFGRMDRLDTKAFLSAHADLLIAGLKGDAP